MDFLMKNVMEGVKLKVVQKNIIEIFFQKDSMNFLREDLVNWSQELNNSSS